MTALSPVMLEQASELSGEAGRVPIAGRLSLQLTGTSVGITLLESMPMCGTRSGILAGWPTRCPTPAII